MATIEPVVAVGLGTVLLGEDLTFPKILGAILVISGAALAQVRVRKLSILVFLRQNGYYVAPR